jgi:hypothetical protein
MRDIVATIQAEQDEIIRLDHPEVLVIEGGPGTGKTVVALHRVILSGVLTPADWSKGPAMVTGELTGWVLALDVSVPCP